GAEPDLPHRRRPHGPRHRLGPALRDPVRGAGAARPGGAVPDQCRPNGPANRVDRGVDGHLHHRHHGSLGPATRRRRPARRPGPRFRRGGGRSPDRPQRDGRRMGPPTDRESEGDRVADSPRRRRRPGRLGPADAGPAHPPGAGGAGSFPRRGRPTGSRRSGRRIVTGMETAVFYATDTVDDWDAARSRLLEAFRLSQEAATAERPIVYVVHGDDLLGRRGAPSAMVATGLLSAARTAAIELARSRVPVNVVAVADDTDPAVVDRWVAHLSDPDGPTGEVIRLHPSHLGKALP